MNDDFQLSDTYAHQLLPQLCFVQTTEFFPNLWNLDANEYANLMWQRLAQLLKTESYTQSISGKKLDPLEGLTVFLVQFPPQEVDKSALRGAAVFEYQRSGVSFAIQSIGCFTQERKGDLVLCRKWEDTPAEYRVCDEQPISGDTEAAFLDAILVLSRPGSTEEPGSMLDPDQLFGAWLPRIPEPIGRAILANFVEVQAAFSEICSEIRHEYPEIAPQISALVERSVETFYKMGVISFAIGSERRSLANQDVVEAVVINELPPDLGIPLHQASDLLGELISQVYDVIETGNHPLVRDWSNRLHALFVLAGRAEISCLVKGMVTFIDEEPGD